MMISVCFSHSGKYHEEQLPDQFPHKSCLILQLSLHSMYFRDLVFNLHVSAWSLCSHQLGDGLVNVVLLCLCSPLKLFYWKGNKAESENFLFVIAVSGRDWLNGVFFNHKPYIEHNPLTVQRLAVQRCMLGNQDDCQEIKMSKYHQLNTNFLG